MKNPFVKTLIIIMTIGVIIVALKFMFNIESPYIETIQFGTLTSYKFNVNNYLHDLEISITNVDALNLTMPENNWEVIDTNILEQEFWEDIGTNITTIFNYFLMFINITLYPFRLVAYIIRQMMQIVGIEMTEESINNGSLQWLVKVIIFFEEKLQIPYAPFTAS